MSSQSPHLPVLLAEIIQSFQSLESSSDTIIDATVGYGGHSIKILESFENINLICNDQDDYALEFSKNRLKSYSQRTMYTNCNFENLLSNIDKNTKISGILADIGVSSLQLDNLDRGFSFKSEELDMRMNQNAKLTANEVINTYSSSQLEDIFLNYGEIRTYKYLTKMIIQNRPFNSARQLADFLKKHLKTHKKIHPATLPFQAIRIEVNQELAVLDNFLESIGNFGLQGTTVAIISFHSLEDKIVKEYFKKWSKNCICDENVMRCECGNNHKKGKIITKKPIVPSQDELKVNKRSRSSKLRIFKFD